MALLATNAMAAAGIQPKHTEVATMTVICTQAVASGAASDGHYNLFKVASGMTIVDAMARLTTAINATNVYYHVGVASGGGQLVSTAPCGANGVPPQRAGASCVLPYTCTADTTIVATLGAASTAASALIVTAQIAPTEQID